MNDLYQFGPPSYEEVFKEVYDVQAVIDEIKRTSEAQEALSKKLTNSQIRILRSIEREK